MKKEIAKKWVKALRSQKFRQGRSVLKRVDSKNVTRHCCLGVLCELYQKEKKAARKKALSVTSVPARDYCLDMHRDKAVFSFGSEETHLPTHVMTWAGLHTSSGEFACDVSVQFGGQSCYDLVSLNDSGASFKKIADAIESNVEML